MVAKRKRWVCQERSLSNRNDRGFLSRGIAKTVAPATREVHRGRVARYLRYLKGTGKVYGLESWVDFLSAIFVQGAAGETVYQYRCALLFVQREALQKGSDLFADDDSLKRACDGLRHVHRLEVASVRGAITLEMLGQLVTLDHEYGVAFKVLFFGVLRVSQLLQMRSGDYVWSDGGILTVRTDKRVRCGRRTSHVHKKLVPSPELRSILGPLQELVPHGGFLFGWVDLNRARDLIVSAAKTFKWPSHLVFDGVHCLRHGGAGELRKRHFSMCSALENPCGMSRSVVTMYSCPNAFRKDRRGVGRREAAGN